MPANVRKREAIVRSVQQARRARRARLTQGFVSRAIERIPRTLVAVGGMLRRGRYPAWARQWQFWLVLATAAVLRLFAIGRSPFGGDDALLFLEASRALHDHLLPGTGIYNSLLALNMPLYTYFLLPFATNPQVPSILTAIANVAAVAGWYVFVQRFFGRGAALIAGLLFATACYDTYMSEFVWQQTILAPLTVVVIATAYVGALERRPHWLVPHVLALAALIQIYLVMAALLPLTLIALWLGRRAIRWLDVAIAAAGSVVLYLPSLLFELGSHGYDLPIYAAYLRAPKQTDAQVFDALAQALGPRPADFFGAATPYAQYADRFGWLTPALMLLWLASTLWLLCSLAAPLIALILSRRPHAPVHALGTLSQLYRQISRPDWLAAAMLLVWPLALVAVMLRHSSPVYVHYVFEITPVIYCTVAIFLTRFPRQLGALLRRAIPRLAAAGLSRWVSPRVLSRAPRWLALGGAALVIVSQGAVTSLLVFTLGTGQATAASWGATPALGYMAVMDAANTWAQRLHSHGVLVVADPGDPYMGLYWAQRGNDLRAPGAAQWSSVVENDCALAPSSQTGPMVVVTIVPAGVAFQQQLAGGGLQALQRFEPARGEVFTIYRADPAPDAGGRPPLASVNGELRLDAVNLLPPAGGTSALLVSDWTVLRSTPAGPAVRQYQFYESVAAAHATPVTLTADCMPSAWIAGERIEVVSALPASLSTTKGLTVQLQVAGSTHSWYQPRVGSLRLDTAKELFSEPVTLPVASPSQSSAGSRPLPVQLGASAITVSLAAGASSAVASQAPQP